MRPVLSRVQLAFVILGLVGACGEDDPQPGPDTGGPGWDVDAGGNNNGGDGDGDGDGDVTNKDASTAQCTSPGQICTKDGEQGFQACVNGELSECIVVTLPEGGFSFPDGGFSFGDGGLPTAACPSSLTCSTTGVLSQLAAFVPGGGGTGLCSEASNNPPACDVPADCTALGFTSAICFDIDQFAQGLSGVASLFGVPPKFCAQPCEP